MGTRSRIHRDADNEAERAYRRGVHQAFAMLAQFVKESGRPLDGVLPLAVQMARDIRGSQEDAPFLLHKLFESIEKSATFRPKKGGKP